MPELLTERQHEILSFIELSIVRRGYPPTRREIVEHFGFSGPNAASIHLKALARKGHITVGFNTARGIQLVNKPKRRVRCPHCRQYHEV